MKDLASLAYVRPADLRGLFEALEAPGACIYAGGTDLLPGLTRDAPWTRGVRTLVDVKGLSALDGVRRVGEDVRIGALLTASALQGDPIVRAELAPLAEAADATSAPALRGRGTLGGNLLSRHPTPYLTTALLALGATVEVADGPDRVRALPTSQFLSGPRDERGAAQRGRPVILGVRVRPCPAGTFEKHGDRSGFARADVAVAVVRRESGWAVAISGVAPRPVAAPTLAATLSLDEGLDAALSRDLSAQGLAERADTRGLVLGLVRRAHRRALGA